MANYNVYGIGNALVDIEYQLADAELAEVGLSKGHMTLCDGARQSELRAALQPHQVNRASGGSAANTCIAIAGFGGSAFYSCHVAGDDTGRYFIDDLNAAGVDSNPHDPNMAGESGTCLVMVTPDAERTMSTCLAISESLSPAQLAPDAIRASQWLYMEGYLAASPTGTAAAAEAHAIAREAGAKTSITLSDASMVNFCRDGLRTMIGDGVDVIFCNEEEAMLWGETEDLDAALDELCKLAGTVCATRGSTGAVLARGDGRVLIPGYPVKALDTVGAGDMFAGAWLYGVSTGGMDAAQATAFANFSAARIVTAYGARIASADHGPLREAFLAGASSPVS